MQLIPYSEHTPFADLLDFVGYLRPRRVVPTVWSDAKEKDRILRRFRGVLDDAEGKRAFLSLFGKRGGTERGREGGSEGGREGGREGPSGPGESGQSKGGADAEKNVAGCSLVEEEEKDEEQEVVVLVEPNGREGAGMREGESGQERGGSGKGEEGRGDGSVVDVEGEGEEDEVKGTVTHRSVDEVEALACGPRVSPWQRRERGPLLQRATPAPRRKDGRAKPVHTCSSTLTCIVYCVGLEDRRIRGWQKMKRWCRGRDGGGRGLPEASFSLGAKRD